MKKIFLLFGFAISFQVGNAQLQLTGTSYTQNFDNLSIGLPTGWSCYKSATDTSLGTLDVYDGSAKYGAFYDTVNCAADVFGHGFKNCASADMVSPTASCAAQQLITNRAFGLRQTSGTGSDPGYDPGAAFVLHLANTLGVYGITASFKLQSLDILSPRSTTWTVDYGLGASPPSFTPVAATGYLVTGNSIFSDTTITANFGSALDNQNQDIWIRIDALSTSTGSGNRTTTAIDDFSLNWTLSGVEGYSQQSGLSLSALGEATPGLISFSYKAQKPGQYYFAINDITGRTVYKQRIEINSSVQNNIVLKDLNLPDGIYIADLHSEVASSIAKVIIR